MTQAEILTLTISALALLVAALSAGWQFASYALEGRRIKLTLVHGAMGRAGFVVGPVGRGGQPRDLRSVRADGFVGTEVLGVTATNVGRAPVTITQYSVALRRGGFSFRPVGDRIGPELPYRLQPGESETWYAEMQSARALVFASAAVKQVSRSVRMTVTLGTGDEKVTRRHVVAQ